MWSTIPAAHEMEIGYWPDLHCLLTTRKGDKMPEITIQRLARTFKSWALS